MHTWCLPIVSVQLVNPIWYSGRSWGCWCLYPWSTASEGSANASFSLNLPSSSSPSEESQVKLSSARHTYLCMEDVVLSLFCNQRTLLWNIRAFSYLSSILCCEALSNALLPLFLSLLSTVPEVWVGANPPATTVNRIWSCADFNSSRTSILVEYLQWNVET